MKRKFIVTLCVLAIGLCTNSTALASSEDPGTAMIADVVLARPACLAATVVGSVFFVLSLPFALTSKRVNEAAEALVVTPARATFTRPLGELDMW